MDWMMAFTFVGVACTIAIAVGLALSGLSTLLDSVKDSFNRRSRVWALESRVNEAEGRLAKIEREVEMLQEDES